MVSVWTTWKLFPLAAHGEHIQAPIGPGLYEVREVGSGELIAFGHTANVAQALAGLAPLTAAAPLWKRALGLAPSRSGRRDLEYRTCATRNRSEARLMAEQMLGRRQAYWRRTMVSGRAA